MRVVIYARVSTDAQERDGTSLETQIEACESFAHASGWTVLHRIRDTASGFILERPGLDRLRDLVRSQQVDAVLAYTVDRLSRNQNHIGILFDEVSSFGLRLEFATETFEDTAVGRFILAARAFVAEIEREKIRERTMRGKARRALAGKLPQGTGRGIYGYTYDPETGRRLPTEPQATVVHRIFEEFATGGSIIGIANRLNADGVPTLLGKHWHSATLFRMLKNPAYAGHTYYRRTKATSIRDPHRGRRRRQVTMRDREEWIEVVGATGAIVSDELFARVQERLADPERLRMGNRTSTYALAGHLRCGTCGAAMVGQTLHRRYRYYRCRRSYSGPKVDRCSARYVRADAIESTVKAAVSSVLAHPELIAAELDQQRLIADQVPPFDAELKALEAERDRLFRAYQSGALGDEQFEHDLVRLRNDRERVLTKKRSSSRQLTGSLEHIDLEAMCRSVGEWIDDAEDDDMTLVANALDLTVTVSPDEASLVGYLPTYVAFPPQSTYIGMTTWT